MSTEDIKDNTEKEVEEYLKFMNNADAINKYHRDKHSPVPEDMQKLYVEDLTKAYRKCSFIYQPKSDLSVLSMKNSILSIIETNSVVVIQGPTGCGKTTQIPQFILDSNIKKRRYCNIIVTQPRRIAAISIAKRVSQEGDWPLGGLVGYRVGMKSEMSKDTRLTYCTTEVLLQQLIYQKHMLDYTHVILDEIHERDQNLDFLLLVIKKLLLTNSSLVKVILMSATINTMKFAKYFSTRIRNELLPAPIVNISEKRFFDIHIYYLDELKDLGGIPEVSPSEPTISPGMLNFCTKIIIALDQIDIMDNEKEKMEDLELSSQRHTVLIFLPGMHEIENLYTFLSLEYYSNNLWELVMLHSLISTDEQQCIFRKPPLNHRRIILSTNIAESSITVPDVKYVIDFCLVKELAIDPISNYQTLQLHWASKINCMQRAGRTGRVMDGRVYRLVPKSFYYNVLDDESTPEMLHAPLANVVLRAKILDLDKPLALLSLSLDPPNLKNFTNTILLLKETGALINDDDDDDESSQLFDGKLTDLGRIMAFLPLDIRISKLIMLGHVFGVLRDAVILGASMEVKDIFLTNCFRPDVSSYMVKKKWARETNSDCIASLNVYKTWQNERANRRLTSYRAEKQWAQRNGVELRTLRELDALVNEITEKLEKLDIRETVGVNKVIWEGYERDFVLQVALVGAFYPNYFVKRSHNIETSQDNMIRNLAALDPMKTIYLQGWSEKQIGYLYARNLQKIFSRHIGVPEQQIMISFDRTKRVHVQFCEKETMLSDQSLYKVSDFVYKAIKMRKCNVPIEIKVLNAKKAYEWSKNQNLKKFERTVFFNKQENGKKERQVLPKIRPILPSLDITFIPLSIQNIISPGCFWATLDDENTREKMSTIETILNYSKPLKKMCSHPKISTLVAAPLMISTDHPQRNDSLIYYRAIIENYTSEIVDIFFIDHGYSSRVRFSDLRSIDDVRITEIPSLAFRCALASLRPSNQNSNLHGCWSKISQDCFKRRICQSKKIFGEIYSVLDSIVNVELIVVNENEEKHNINQYLIDEGYAMKRAESYLSKCNHDLRSDINVIHAMCPEEKLFYEEQQYVEDCLSQYPDPPEEEDCDSQIKLQGPFSPLEIDLVQLTASGKLKEAHVEINSVNSVILDENLDRSTRLLVAQNISQINGNQLILRNTTLLPNVPGLVVLLALIFAPRIELRRSPMGTYYIGALCGLGPMSNCTENAFLHHDMEIPFDVEISLDDLREINKLRHWMNIGMRFKRNDHPDYKDEDDEQIMSCQNRIKCTLLELRDRRRQLQDQIDINNFDIWNRYDASMFLHPAFDTKKNEIYPLHKALVLRERNDKLEKMVKHLIELYQLSNEDDRKMGNVETFCKLCKVKSFGLWSLRSHFSSEHHIENEKSLQIADIRDYYYHY